LKLPIFLSRIEIGVFSDVTYRNTANKRTRPLSIRLQHKQNGPPPLRRRALPPRTHKSPQVSTDLYPDFTLGALPHVDAAVAREVQRALLALNGSDAAPRLGGYDSFQPPLSFARAREVLENVGMFRRSAATGRMECVQVSPPAVGAVGPGSAGFHSRSSPG
jgi:hypothetical protein